MTTSILGGLFHESEPMGDVSVKALSAPDIMRVMLTGIGDGTLEYAEGVFRERQVEKVTYQQVGAVSTRNTSIYRLPDGPICRIRDSFSTNERPGFSCISSWLNVQALGMPVRYAAHYKGLNFTVAYTNKIKPLGHTPKFLSPVLPVVLESVLVGGGLLTKSTRHEVDMDYALEKYGEFAKQAMFGNTPGALALAILLGQGDVRA